MITRPLIPRRLGHRWTPSLGAAVLAAPFLWATSSAWAVTPPPPPPPPPTSTPTTLPTSLTLGSTTATVAADGVTAVVATLRRADGRVLDTNAYTVNFSSACAAVGQATLDTTQRTTGGQAAVTYLPRGCRGADTVTASVTVGSTVLRASWVVQVGSTTALSPKAALGRAMFFDRALSANGQQACASCHSPAHGYFTPGPNPTPLGGVSGTTQGFRSAPSAAYAALSAPFTYLLPTNRDGSVNAGAKGSAGVPRNGQTWDGRATTVSAQAQAPFISVHEMANANSAAVLSKLLQRPYLTQYTTVYGAVSASSDANKVLTNMAEAIGQFETEDASFKLFNSKYDAALQGQASLSAQEANGQALFFNANKGACAGCHNSLAPGQGPVRAQLFTDHSYRVLAVPRNWALPYNNDAQVTTALRNLGATAMLNGSTLGAPSHLYYDLGFCGPLRSDTAKESTLCGAFKVPSLRNVALKGAYFHNGVYNGLGQVLNFYLSRDRNPQAIYTKANGTADIAYNDLPVVYQGNREVRPPFTPSPSGQRLTPNEVQDLITFLCTLTDGYDPHNPQAYRQPPQCQRAVR